MISRDVQSTIANATRASSKNLIFLLKDSIAFSKT